MSHLKTDKPTLVLGSYFAFLNYQRDHPHDWLVHVTREEHCHGYEAEGVIVLDSRFSPGLYQYALTRVR